MEQVNFTQYSQNNGTVTLYEIKSNKFISSQYREQFLLLNTVRIAQSSGTQFREPVEIRLARCRSQIARVGIGQPSSILMTGRSSYSWLTPAISLCWEWFSICSRKFLIIIFDKMKLQIVKFVVLINDQGSDTHSIWV